MGVSSQAANVVARVLRREFSRLRVSVVLITFALLCLNAFASVASSLPDSGGHAAVRIDAAGDGGVPQVPLHRDSPAKPRRAELAVAAADSGAAILPTAALPAAPIPALARVRPNAGLPHANAAPTPDANVHRRQQGRAPPQA